MSLESLPNELLREIVQHLRPYNKHEPITGFNAAWKPLSIFRQSLKSGPSSITISPYSTVMALRSTCSLMRELCAPLMFENLNLLSRIKDPEGFYSSTLVPNATHVRNIRISLDEITAEMTIRCLSVCRNATSLAFYSDKFDEVLSAYSEETHSICAAVVGLLKEGSLDSVGMYAPGVIEGEPSQNVSEYPLLDFILESSEASRALKHFDLVFYGDLIDDLYDRIRLAFTSLESLTIQSLLHSVEHDLWPLTGPVKWAQYSNLQRLQFRDCGAVYVNRIPYLVRHFPSLIHVLISACDSEGADDNTPEDWYDRKDALWKIRKPLETLHLEHMFRDEILTMGEIPVKTLIITDSRPDYLVDGMIDDDKIFPGLRTIRIQPVLIPEYQKGVHSFTKKHLADLKEVCEARELTLLRDAEATSYRHRY